MPNPIQHLYKFSASHGGVLYAWFLSMHTRVDLMLCGSQGEEELMRVVDAVYELLHRLEKMANFYDPDSELGQLNLAAAVRPQPVSRELYEMLSFCVDCHTRTGGCFDVTVHSDGHTPDTIRDIRLSPQDHTLYFLRPGVRVNLSGFLKGYALDRIRTLLQDYGMADAVVNMGNSSVMAMGNRPSAVGWTVDFSRSIGSLPGGNSGVLLQNECLTTSGNDSAERKHIIDPRSGQLLEGERELAVVTAEGAVGEVLSTALFVADARQRELIAAEFCPRLILDL